MRRLKDGDDGALEEIIDRWREKLSNYLYRANGSQIVACELTQETFIRVYESRLKYLPCGSFSSWLFAIATNSLREHLRRARRHPTVSLEEIDSERCLFLADYHYAVESFSEADREELVREVKKAIQQLPRKLQEVVYLFEYQNYSHDQIARRVGCSKKAVEGRLYRARAILRKALRRFYGKR